MAQTYVQEHMNLRLTAHQVERLLRAITEDYGDDLVVMMYFKDDEELHDDNTQTFIHATVSSGYIYLGKKDSKRGVIYRFNTMTDRVERFEPPTPVEGSWLGAEE